MPYISIRTTNKFNSSDDTSSFAKEITINLSDILKKGVDTIMLDIQTVDSLYLGGREINNGAVVEVKAFGVTPPNTKKQVNNFIVNLFESNFNIIKSNIYVIYSDKQEWGYKGSFISK